ncbi:hypothetical protein LG324_01450 [Phycicoccus jejuensis]|uniref:hypothetical protein n=1 Tax=Phycicoccus jejuensis TaxID=367299 RepID=UPI00384F0A66
MRDIGRIPVTSLALDPQNPRLPERIQGGRQEELLEYLFENDVLDELAASFIANGYFDNEPILVLPEGDDGKRIVVEGNRRVSTLLVLAQADVALELDLAFDLTSVPTPDQVERLSTVPAYEVENREELGAYLGYRHIGGIRPWPAESKARWIHRSVLAAVDAGAANPFYEVGRTFGSNARGVRTSYLTLELLRRARVDFGIDTTYVERNRFSVWGILVSNTRIREYIHLQSDPRDFAAIQDALEGVRTDRVGDVVRDLTPDGSRPALLADSRMVSKYAEVLVNERAHEVLRSYGDLTLATAVLEQGALADRLNSHVRGLRELLVDAGRLPVDTTALNAATELSELARSIRAVVADRFASDE